MKNGRQGEGGGNPMKVITDDQLDQIEKLASVLSKQQIADYLCVGRTTFYDIEQRQPEVLEHYNRGKSKAIGSVAQGLLQKAQSGDTQSAIFYLKTQAGWKEKQDINHTSDDGSMTPKENNSDLITEALKAKYANK
tara:strand:- start:15 stop:422 length:408 start_codon:yes stop_codon:yes gene_type:complete